MTRTSSGMIKEAWYDAKGDTIRADINGRTIESIQRRDRLSEITDEKGHVTQKRFDEFGNLTSLTRTDGRVTLFEYDLRFNKVSLVRGPAGNKTLHKYDNKGNLIQKIEAANSPLDNMTTRYAYDDSNQLISAAIDGDYKTESVTATFTYDNAGNLTSITDPMGGVTRITAYNNMGSPEIIRDARGNTWEFRYDAIGRLISRKDPLNNVTSIEYDGANNPTSVINALLKRYEFEYDDHNIMIKATDPYSKFVAIEYNTDNLPVQVADQENKRSAKAYDNEGRLIKTTDGAGNEIVYHYDESTLTPALSDQPVRIDYPTFSRAITYDELQRIRKISDISKGDVEHSRTFE